MNRQVTNLNCFSIDMDEKNPETGRITTYTASFATDTLESAIKMAQAAFPESENFRDSQICADDTIYVDATLAHNIVTGKAEPVADKGTADPEVSAEEAQAADRTRTLRLLADPEIIESAAPWAAQFSTTAERDGEHIYKQYFIDRITDEDHHHIAEGCTDIQPSHYDFVVTKMSSMGGNFWLVVFTKTGNDTESAKFSSTALIQAIDPEEVCYIIRMLRHRHLLADNLRPFMITQHYTQEVHFGHIEHDEEYDGLASHFVKAKAEGSSIADSHPMGCDYIEYHAGSRMVEIMRGETL